MAFKETTQHAALESLELIQLPSLPHILGHLLDICHDPKTQMADLANIIASDAALAGKILTAVNSAAFGIQHRITSLQQAVSLLGLDLIKTMAITSSVQQLFSGLTNQRSEFLCQIWLDSLYCAVIAHEMALAIKYDHPEDAYLAGLLHDFGQLVFDAKFHRQYQDILKQETQSQQIQQENSLFGMTHAELGALIIEGWQDLNPNIADATRFHHDDRALLAGSDKLIQLVAEASEMAAHWGQYGEADPNWSSSLVESQRLSEINNRIQQKVIQTAKSLGIKIPDATAVTHKQLKQDLERVNVELAEKVRDNALLQSVTQGSVKEFISAPDILLNSLARELYWLFSMQDMVLLMPTEQEAQLALSRQESKRIEARFAIAANTGRAGKSFIAGTRQWLFDNPHSKVMSNVVDRQILRRLKQPQGLCLPLHHQNKVIGVLIVGCHPSDQQFLESRCSLLTNYINSVTQLWQSEPKPLHHEDLPNEETASENLELRKLAHEISNPLTVIGNYIEIIKQKSGEYPEQQKEVVVLAEELQRVRKIISQYGNQPLSTGKQTLSLNKELSACIPLYLKSLNGSFPIELQWQLDPSDAQIQLNRDTLRQIILNLLKNAVEAKSDESDKAMITVSTKHFINHNGNSYAQFAINDRGTGINGERRKELFQPLKSEKQGDNRGIGLSVVNELVKQLDGQIRFTNNQYGGALFEVMLPLEVVS